MSQEKKDIGQQLVDVLPIVKKVRDQFCRTYYVADREDFLQVLLINAWNILLQYDENHNVPLEAFLTISLRKRASSYITFTLRKKRQFERAALRLGAPAGCDEEETFADLLLSNKANVEEIYLWSEYIQTALTLCTPLERVVWCYRNAGYEYEEIADFLHITKKGVDNAIQRIRQKIKKHDKKELLLCL